MSEEEQTSVIARDNANYLTESIVGTRLNTQPIIDRVELFLRGSRTVYVENDDGEIEARKVSEGVPKANDQGVQGILSYLVQVVNPMTVQSWYDEQNLSYYLQNVHKGITDTIMVNCYRWEIHDDDINLIIDGIMNFVEPFMRRTLGNKERESYEQMKYVESNTQQQPRRGFFK